VLTTSRRLKIKHNYLNNKDILKEIHKSKNTYCTYASPNVGDYDLIIDNVSKINKKIILEARKLRAERLTKLAHEAAVLATGTKQKLDDFEIKYTKIPQTEVVFRVMTWEHIPLDNAKTQKAKNVAKELYEDEEEIAHTEYDEDDPKHNKYVKVNFPPFFHYCTDDEGNPILVGKSHWKGDLETGEFCRDHGSMTNKLALMFMKLCERYATRSNWRGYTYNDEMRSQALLQLSQIGLQFDESKSQNPFAYYTAAITNSFTRVLNIEKRNQNLRDDILEMNGLNPSYTRQGMTSGGGGAGGGGVDGDD
jgi:hypothetical protein